MSIRQDLDQVSKKTAGLRWPLQALIVMSLFVITSCGGGGGDSGGGGTTTEFTRSAELIANSANIMKTGFDRLNTSVSALNGSIMAYCASPDASKRADAQAAFKTAMSDLQHSMLHQLGPSRNSPGNSNMLELYSWPTTNICEIDKRLAQGISTLQIPVNRRGMDALEYLLFVEPATGHSCPAGTLPAAELAAFNALGNADREARRCDYMLPVAADVAGRAQTLATAWGSHVATMTGTTNIKTTLNEVTDAMYFFREDLREFKLGRPLGGDIGQRKPSCGVIGSGACPEDVELPHARISKESLRSNVLAFKQLYFGGDGGTASVGFDDWLRDIGSSDVADKLSGEIETVLTSLDAVSGSLFDAISPGGDINSVNSLLAAVDDVSKTFRFDVLSALGLNVPAGLASDTD